MLPRREDLERNRLIRPVAHLLLRPALWRFTRRSVPRAVGLGLFFGIALMLPFVQFVGAALIAVPFRANVPLTAGVTLLSNPVTTPAIVIAALSLGSWIIGVHADPHSVIAMAMNGATLAEWMAWLRSDAAPALLIGLLLIATVAGAIGYVASAVGWRWWIGHKWARRRHERQLQG